MNDEEEDNEAFLHRFCICEEDRLARTGEMRAGLNGPRWFRSENIVPIEQARARRNQSQSKGGKLLNGLTAQNGGRRCEENIGVLETSQ
jgi:hypothetical protein